MRSIFGKTWVTAAVLPAALLGASLSGSVVENATGRPLARARVLLEVRSGSGYGGPLSVRTGSAGDFAFSSLPAGIYFLRVEKRGYAPVRYGQRRFDRPGTPIVLAADARFVAEIRLRRLGVITGQVVDENQIGLPDVSVYAYRKGSRLQMVEAATTDDRGVYRLAGLKPGRYLVRTAARQLPGGSGLLPTYYGQVTRAAGAPEVPVRLDQEVTGVDIAPRPGHLATLSGTLANASAGTVVLVTDTGPRKARVEPGRRFRFGGLEPGKYTLLIDPAAAGGQLAAYQPVWIGDQNVDLAVTLQPAPRLRIRCQAAGGGSLDTRSVSIFLRRKQYGATSGRIRCGETAVWAPGVWQLGVAPPPQYYVAAIEGAATSGDTNEFTVKPGRTTDVTIVFDSHPASLSGQVRTADGAPALGAPVYLRAVDAGLRSRAGGVREVRADAAGKYHFLGLPPGKYEAISSYQLENGSDERWTPGLGTTVPLDAGEQRTLELELTQIP